MSLCNHVLSAVFVFEYQPLQFFSFFSEIEISNFAFHIEKILDLPLNRKDSMIDMSEKLREKI